jgi:hypothetical protein
MRRLFQTLVLAIGFSSIPAVASDAGSSNITPEFLTVKATSSALELYKTNADFGLKDIKDVTAATSKRSDLSIYIELSFKTEGGRFKECKMYNWYDFDGNSVQCDACRNPPPGTGCTCVSSMCTASDGEVYELTN